MLTGVLRIFGGFAAEERVGRRWTLGGIVLGTLELALGALLLLTSGVDPDLLVPIVAAWGAVSGILLLAQGLRLRRFAHLAAGTGNAAPGSLAECLAHSGPSPTLPAPASHPDPPSPPQAGPEPGPVLNAQSASTR